MLSEFKCRYLEGETKGSTICEVGGLVEMFKGKLQILLELGFSQWENFGPLKIHISFDGQF